MHKFAPNPSPVPFPNPTDHSKRYGVSLLRGGTLMAMYCFWYLHLSTGERPEGKKKSKNFTGNCYREGDVLVCQTGVSKKPPSLADFCVKE